MHEFVVNLHMHTTYSDGYGSHMDIVRAALQSPVDGVIVTDHNVLVSGVEGYYQENGKRVLLLVGEEVHDRTRLPQKNHLLVFGANRELSPFGTQTQRLIEQVRQCNGAVFIAHPDDPPMASLGEEDISWEDWSITGYTGIEIWNGLTEIKVVSRSRLEAIFYVLFPHLMARSPIRKTLERWDELTSTGRKIVGIGGSDAHELRKSMGPIHAVVFPYTYHFRAVNTHLYLAEPPSGEINADRQAVIQAFREGHAFIGYDLPASTRGFRFTAQGRDQTAWMGDDISAGEGITIQIHLPQPAECHLIKDGKTIKTWTKRDNCTHMTKQPGVYRVEVYLEAFGRKRGWIFSNPIYVRP